MPEPLSIALGVLQVADTGVKLAKTLYGGAQNIKNAKVELKRLADEVDSTSSILRNFGELLKEDDTARICRPALHTDALSTLDRCNDAFNELDAAVQSCCKPASSSSRSNPIPWKWPFNKNRTMLLQDRLKGLKSDLTLMLSMLQYARMSSSK